VNIRKMLMRNMRRFIIPLLVVGSLAHATSAWEATTSQNVQVKVTAGQAVASLSLSNNSFAGGAASGTVVGGISLTMSPASPAFSGTLSLSGTDAAKFQIIGTNLETNGVVPTGSYQINIIATQSGVTNSPFPQAETITGSNVSCPRGTSYQDGCPGAPSGTLQYPNILSGYVSHPPWNVAGVDYHIGVPSSTTLQDPATATLPNGASYHTNYSRPNTTVSYAVVLSTPGGTVSSLDFSLRGGIQLLHLGGNWTIENSKFAVGGQNTTTCGPRESGGSTYFCGTAVYSPYDSAGNLTFQNIEIDGGGVGVSPQAGATVDLENTGTNTFRYDYFHDSGGDMIDFYWGTGANHQPCFIQYNLFSAIGVNTSHEDTLQWLLSTVPSCVIGFNTVYQNESQPGAGNGAFGVGPSEGVGGATNGLSLSNILFENNTIIQTAACTGCNWTLHFYVDLTSNTPAPTADHVTYKDNYIDPTGAQNYTGMWLLANNSYGYNFAHPMTISNTVNMVTGGIYTAYPAAQSWVAAPDFSGYTPPMSDIYAVTAQPATGTFTAGQQITFTVCMDDVYTLSGGTPNLVLSSGGTAVYLGGSGSTICTDSFGTGTRSSALSFRYTIGTGDAAIDLQVSSFSLNNALIRDGVGNSANVTARTGLFPVIFRGLNVSG
jgi:hypothetical protein